MSQKNLQKDRSRYFRQTDTLRLVGGALAIIGIAWYYFGYSYASYIIPTIITPIGVVLFILGSCRHIGDNDMDEEIQRLLLDYDQSVTSRADFSRLVLKHPSDVQTQAYVMQHPAQYFKRGKNSKPMSDICIKSHFFFTKDALLVCMRQLNLAQDPTDGGVSDNELALAFASIVKAEILEKK